MNAPLPSKNGAALVVVVLSMIAAGLVGTAILSKTASSRYERIQFGLANRAYYLAESGASYVRAQRAADPTFYPSNALTLTLANGDQFTVVVVTNAARPGHVGVLSTGIAHPGTALEARQQIHFEIDELRRSADTLPVGFDIDGDGEFDEELWDLDGVTASIKETGPSGKTPALDLKGEVGQVNLVWQDNPEIDLVQAWRARLGLLSYDVQLKIQPFLSGVGFSQSYMLGLSFRLHPDTNNCYGLSFFRSLVGQPQDKPPDWVNALPASIRALRGTNSNPYVLLWYRATAASPLELLNYRELTAADADVVAWTDTPKGFRHELRDYSTLLVQLREAYTMEGARTNHIVVYIQGTNTYPLWSTGDPTNAVWQENAAVFPASNLRPLVWHDGAITNGDGRITSADFDLLKPSEIGIHVFYDLIGDNKKFFSDFALRVQSTAGGTQIQY